MHRFIWLLLITISCTNHTELTFDPFNYDPQAYEEVSLNYKVTGKGDTTLFFIHGWNLDQSYWQNQEAEFSSSYRLVLLDLAGCGSSGKNRKNWTVESFAKDITTVINKENLSNVILVAHSMGGEIALDVASANPEKVIGIIGIDNLKDAGVTITKKDRQGIQPYIREFLSNYPKMAEAMAREFTVSKDSTIIQRLVNSYKNADPSIAVPSLINVYPKSEKAKEKLMIMPFEMKFIMSTITPYDENIFRKYCKNGYQIITIDSAGHFPMIERPAEFNKALHQLLKAK